MFKNKTIKLIFGLIISIVMFFSLCSSMVYAADSSKSTKLSYARIVKNSNGEYENKNGYALNTGTNHPIFQIVSVNGSQTTGTNYFCLDATSGSTWSSNIVGTAVDYDKSYDLVNDKSEISKLVSTYSDIAKSDYYTQILWLLDNMYVADSSTESISDYLAKAGLIKQDKNTNTNDLGWYIDTNNQKHYIYAYYFDESKIKAVNSNSIFANTSSDVYKQLYGNLDGKGGYYYYDDNENMVDVTLSADLIESVEQAAIWYFTNYLNNTTATTDDNSEYNCYTSDSATSILDWLRYAEDTSTSTLSWKLLSNKTLTAKTLDADKNIVTQTINEGAMLQEQADILYNYLIDSANAAAKNGYKSTSTGTLKIEFSGNSSDEKIVEDGNNYKIGPLKVTTTGNTTITGVTVTSGSTDITSNATLKDESGNTITTPTSGTNFYVVVPKSSATASIKVGAKGTTTATEKNLWIKSTTDNANAEQPIVEIKPTTKSLNDDVTIPLEKLFDLALRKVITKITDSKGNTISILNENNLDATRNITIDDSTIPDTATYKHRKDPVVVKTNYVVTYNINIYNEGEIDGYPSEIVDQLPTGLESTLGDTATSTNGNTYSVTYDKTTNKITFTLTSSSPKSIAAYDGNKLSSDTIEVTAKVTQKAETNGTTKHYLTNIAYISGEKDSSGNSITEDRDGTESKTTDSPTQSSSELNSTDADSYKGNKDNQSVYNDTNNNYYYEGQEDDDDFEKVVVLPEELDLALRKFITKVSTDGKFSDASTTKSYDRTPKVDTSKLKAGTATTATYNHSKKPIYSDAGDYILYTIRAYNEGDLNCYASEITDYLPEYLDFVDSTDTYINSINSKWTYDAQTRKVTTTADAANATTLLKAFDSTNDDGNGSGLSYVDVQIVCKINKNVTSGKKLTNIAEVTKYKDEDGNEIDKDRDSSSDNLNYPDNPETYKDDETNKDYVPGQEDDDDFEKIIVKKPGKYDVILIKEDKDGKQLDSKATFEVNGEKKEVTGTLVIADDVEINSDNVNTPDTYTIKETVPPDEYCKFDGTITITANKTSTDSNYTLKDLNYKVTDSNGNDITSTKDANVYLKDGNIYVEVKDYQLDLALRKFITQVSTDGNFSDTTTTTNYDRTPNVDTSKLKAGTATTATYNHSKKPIYLNAGDYILYTIRVYNEGDLNCYASEVTDYLPEYLDFVDSTDTYINSINSKWTYDSQTRKVTTTGKAANAKTLLKAFDAANDNGNGSGLSYVDVQIICKINKNVTSGKKLTNIAEITGCKDENGNEIKKDKDSSSDNLNYPDNPETYKDDETNKDYVPGQEDDDDFEKVIVKVNTPGKYDVILIKEDKDGKQLDSKATFEVNGEKKEVTGTLVIADDVEINSDNVNTPDTYTIKETIPPDKYCKFDGTITITANKTSTGSSYTLKDLNYKVTDSNGNDITSTKDANVYLKDGNIYVEVKDYQFDLALRKFITAISGKEVTTRIPQVEYKDGKITYKHSKDVVKVVVGDVVTYTIRVFNEGEVAGYAETVTDDIPEYLEYLPDNDLNKTYRWKMYDKDGKETSKVSDAVKIVTDYTSKANGETLMKTKNLKENPNLLNPFDSSKEISDTNPDYVDVKVAFKVKDPNSNKTVITNKAQISEDADENGNPIDDIDSIPNEWNDGEDDQDYENVSVEYFDLSLLKYVTKAIVTEDGKTTTTKTGNNGSSKDITPKVEIHRKKINKTVVKFEYTIKITNEGDIAGYAKEIKDYVPNGLKFYAADNKNWKDEGNNVISTTALKNTLLQPGESATVTVVLRWINGEGNLNLKVNTAEISKDYNDKGVPDRDSTPDNQKKGEDDIDDAPVLLTIATGMLEHTIEYVCGALVILVVIGLGVVAIRKFVL